MSDLNTPLDVSFPKLVEMVGSTGTGEKTDKPTKRVTIVDGTLPKR